MYSFHQRADTTVLDEPLYAHYLHVSGAPHPGRDVVLAAQENAGEKVVRNVILGACDRPILFIKHMAHHLVDLDWGFLRKTVNVLLIRDPEQMLPSLINQIPRPVLSDTGLEMQSRLYRHLVELGQNPPVVDARELLLDPGYVLHELCREMGISFDSGQLSWPAGPIEEDGAWAPFWYHSIHQSTGFQAYRPKREPFPAWLKPLLEECRPHYAFLYSKAIRALES